MIRRADTFSQPVSTTFEAAETEKATEQNKNKTDLILEHPAETKYKDGGASLVSEFHLKEQATQASLQNQLRDTVPGQITKDPSVTPRKFPDVPEVIRPDRFGPPAPSPGPAPVQIKSELSLNDRGPQVESFQRQLNEWRANQNPPLPPLKEKGVYGDETEKAVKDFQTTTGLKSDGIAGGNTKDRLAVENNQNFKKLDPDTQKQIREKLNEYQKDPDSRKNLKQLATDPNFPRLSRATQEDTLNRLASNSKDAAHAQRIQGVVKDIASMEDGFPDFKGMSPDSKKKAVDRMYKYADNDTKRGHLKKILTDSKFTKLPIDQQEKLLQVYDKRPDATLSEELRKIINSPAWAQMDDKMKSRVFDMLNANAGKVIGKNARGPILDEAYTNNLAQLLSDPSIKFDKYSQQDKEKALNVFENSGLFGRAPLLKFMRMEINGVPAPLKPDPGNTGTALDQLNKLATSTLDSKIVDAKGNPVLKAQVLEDLCSELSNPKQNINEGNRKTSSVTGMTRTLAEQNPAEYARIVTELETTGQAKLANGETIRPTTDAWNEDKSGRSVGERLLQSALMDYGRPGGGYKNWNAGPDGIRGTKDDGFPGGNIDGFPPDGGGLQPSENTRIFNGLSGKKP